MPYRLATPQYNTDYCELAVCKGDSIIYTQCHNWVLDFDYWLKPPTHLSRLTAIKVSCRTLRLSSLKDYKIRHIILRRKQWTSHRLSPIFGHLDYPLCTAIITFIQLGKTPSGGFEPPHLLQPIALAVRPLQPNLSKTAKSLVRIELTSQVLQTCARTNLTPRTMWQFTYLPR